MVLDKLTIKRLSVDNAKEKKQTIDASHALFSTFLFKEKQLAKVDLRSTYSYTLRAHIRTVTSNVVMVYYLFHTL